MSLLNVLDNAYHDREFSPILPITPIIAMPLRYAALMLDFLSAPPLRRQSRRATCAATLCDRLSFSRLLQRVHYQGRTLQEHA